MRIIHNIFLLSLTAGFAFAKIPSGPPTGDSDVLDIEESVQECEVIKSELTEWVARLNKVTNPADTGKADGLIHEIHRALGAEVGGNRKHNAEQAGHGVSLSAYNGHDGPPAVAIAHLITSFSELKDSLVTYSVGILDEVLENDSHHGIALYLKEIIGTVIHVPHEDVKRIEAGKAAETIKLNKAYGSIKASVGSWKVRFFDSLKPNGLTVGEWFVQSHPKDPEQDSPFAVQLFMSTLRGMIEVQENEQDQHHFEEGPNKEALKNSIATLEALENNATTLLTQYKNVKVNPADSFAFSDTGTKRVLEHHRLEILGAKVRLDTAESEETIFGTKSEIESNVGNAKKHLAKAEDGLIQFISNIFCKWKETVTAHDYKFFNKVEWNAFIHLVNENKDELCAVTTHAQLIQVAEDLLHAIRKVFRGIYPVKDEFSPRGFITSFSPRDGQVLRWYSPYGGYAWRHGGLKEY